MSLKVIPAAKEDVYRDIVRINEKFRVDKHGEVITEGSVCRVDVPGRTVFALMRGITDSEDPVIRIDEHLRNRLGVNIGDNIDLILRKSGCIGQFLWAWNSSDPAYRIVARLSVLSMILGLIGVALGILSIVSG